MAAYMVVEAKEITDPAAIGQYSEQAAALVARHGGKYLMRGPVTPLEGDWQPMMVVVVEFASMERLQAFYHSPEYAPLIALRQGGSVTNFVAGEGL